MLKLVGRFGSQPILVLGLTGENMTRLMADEPVLVHGAELGLPNLSVAVIGGRTDADLAAQAHEILAHRTELSVQTGGPSGVLVREEWAVRAADGKIYGVADDREATAVREATLLFRGVDGDPERTPEPGCAPARRYVMDTPDGPASTPWRWPANWSPPDPAETSSATAGTEQR